MSDLQEFKEWLDRNGEHFKGYSVEEIGNLALTCGFERSIVVQWQTSARFRGVTVNG